ncbi:MAG: hypothetical protein SGI92_28355 [Bryobacteraceae bacterium]|nr:hypothetical protein [Bryobacteraceae bacterium]
MTEGRTLNDDLRTRIGGRIPSLGLRSLIPFAGSLARNPLYGSAYYIAADSIVEGVALPFLLHLTLASAPSNPVYPGAMLIGRLRPGGGREIVVDAVPFGSGDPGAVRLFVEKIDDAFLPRPSGMQSAVSVTAADPARDLPAAFEAFRLIRRHGGVNLASFSSFPGAPVACAWAAIRAGWRHGYSLETQILGLNSEISAEYSTFRIDVTGADTASIIGFVSKIQRVRRLPDIELVWRQPVPATELAGKLQELKTAGVSPQLVCLPDAVENVAELAPVVRAAGATLSFSAEGLTPESARTVGSTAGRFRCRLETPGASAEDIAALAAQLRA